MTGPILIEDEGPQVLPGDGAAVAVPSGQAVTFLDVILNAPGPNGMATRFRFVAPAIARVGGSVDFDAAAEDMAHLCQNFVLPKLAELGPTPAQVIVSLSDSDVPFGEAAPEATQFFEAYTIEGNTCIWEAF